MAIRCSNCQQNNPDGMMKCIYCDKDLNTTTEIPEVMSNQEDTPMELNPDMRSEKYQTNNLNSVEDDEEEKETRSASDTSDDDKTHATTKMPHMDDEDGLLHIGSVRFRGNLILKDKDTNHMYRIENDKLQEAVIGRLNMKTGFRPQVDFTDDNGKKRGVSRRHATITQRGDLIFVTDHNSLNGTYLNGQRLVPEQSRVVRDSDSLRIGHISLIVIFEDIS